MALVYQYQPFQSIINDSKMRCFIGRLPEWKAFTQFCKLHAIVFKCKNTLAYCIQKSFITTFKGLITAYADYLVANNIKGIFSKISFFRKKYFYLTKQASLSHHYMSKFCCRWPQKGRIFSRERPFYERAVSNLERSMHRSLWV